MTRRMMTVTALAGVAMLGLGGCSKLTEPYKDAPINERNTQPAQVGTMPDGFSNFATKCDHGNRVYVIFKGDNPNGSIAVVQNAKDC